MTPRCKWHCIGWNRFDNKNYWDKVDKAEGGNDDSDQGWWDDSFDEGDFVEVFYEYDDIVYNDENNDVNDRESYVDEDGGFVDTEGATMRMMMSAGVVYVS
jgi:hypothetical protein